MDLVKCETPNLSHRRHCLPDRHLMIMWPQANNKKTCEARKRQVNPPVLPPPPPLHLIPPLRTHLFSAVNAKSSKNRCIDTAEVSNTMTKRTTPHAVDFAFILAKITDTH